MKVALALFVALAVLAQTNAFIGGRGLGIGRGILPGFGRFGAFGGPWRFGMMGMPWGMGPWGMGGLGFGMGMPWRMGMMGMGMGMPWGMHPGLIGKRSVEVDVLPTVPVNRTLCSFTSKTNILSCHGAKHNFECKAVPNFVNLNSISYRVQNLTVVPEHISLNDELHRIYRLFSCVNEQVNDYTLLEKTDKKVVFNVYGDDDIKENGIRIEDDTCWSSFTKMMKETTPHHSVRFALFINNVTKQ